MPETMSDRSDHDILTRLDARSEVFDQEWRIFVQDVKNFQAKVNGRLMEVEKVAASADESSRTNLKLLTGAIIAVLASIGAFIMAAKDKLFGG